MRPYADGVSNFYKPFRLACLLPTAPGVCSSFLQRIKFTFVSSLGLFLASCMALRCA